MEAATQSRLAVLLFTDIVGSVALKTRLGDGAAAALIGRHDEIFKATMREYPHGTTLKDTGDGFLAQFDTVSDAVCFALRFQLAMSREDWKNDPLHVRVGIHFGEVAELAPESTGLKKISGLAVDVAARIMGLAEGGQTLLTRSAFDNARQYVREFPRLNGDATPEIKWMAHGPYLLRGSEDPVEVFEVGGVGLSPLKAPGDSEKARRAVRPGEEDVLGWRPAAGLEIPGRKGWVLDHRLGEGGFGEVWLGLHKKTRDPRAFKFCFDADRLRSFKRELTLFRVLREVLGERQDIAKLYEVSLERSPYVLESEYSPFGNLADWAEKKGGIDKVPVQARIRIVARAARAVAAAHSVGVLHKDIKPSNILMFETDDGEARPRITDFGIGMLTDMSQLEKHNITITGMTEGLVEENASSRTGTRMYAPPELLSGAPFSVQGDIYALGVFLYQMAVGDFRRPLAQGWERDVPDPVLRADISDCVQGDPARRLQSAAELADRLEHIDQRRAARAKAEKTRKLRRLGKIAAAAAAVIAVVAVGFGLREYSLRRQVENERNRAEGNFKQLHGFMQALTFDVSDRLRSLIGTVKPREVILKSLRDHITLMETEARDDPGFRFDLAVLYDKAGEIQGGLNEAKTGQTAAAGDDFAKARTILDDLLRASPSDGALQLAQARVSRHTGEFIQRQQQDYTAARAEYAKAVTEYDRAAGLLTDPARKREATDGRWAAFMLDCDAAYTQGELLGDAEARSAAMRDLDTRLATAEAYWQTQVTLGGEDGAAAERQALIVRSKRDRAARLTADALIDRKDFDSAEKLLGDIRTGAQKTAERLDELVTARGDQSDWLRTAMLGWHDLGLVCDQQIALLDARMPKDSPPDTAFARKKASLQADSLAYYQRALAIARSLRASDVANFQARQDHGDMLNKVGNILLKTGHLEDARAIYTESLTLRESNAALDPTATQVRRVAVGRAKMGDVETNASETAEPTDRAAALKSARAAVAWFEGSLQKLDEAKEPADSKSRASVADALQKARNRVQSLGG